MQNKSPGGDKEQLYSKTKIRIWFLSFDKLINFYNLIQVISALNPNFNT